MSTNNNEQKGTPLPEHGDCFVCGTSNPKSLGVQWYMQADKTIMGEVTLIKAQQGPPMHAHGGASAAILDEVMGGATWANGYMVMTASMTVNYRRPVPLGVPLMAKGWVHEKVGRKVYAKSIIQLPDGTVAVEGEGIFVENPRLFEQYAKQFENYKQTGTLNIE